VVESEYVAGMVCAAFILGVFAFPAMMFLHRMWNDAVWSFGETRFRISAQWQYNKTLPVGERRRRRAFVIGAIRAWWHFWLWGGSETTSLIYKGGIYFQRGPNNEAIRM
jgi:hypothetical protein